MLRNFEAEYETVKAPIKNCSFIASGGADVEIRFDKEMINSVTITIGKSGILPERNMSYNKADLGHFIEVLQNIQAQL